MKGILGLLRSKTLVNKSKDESTDSMLFSTAFAGQGVDDSMLVPWEARAVEVGAKRLPASRGGKLLQGLWAKDKYMAHLDKDAVERMERFFEFASVPSNRDLIRQDEYGNFMVVLLTGTIAVDRVQPWGEQLRLAETRPGDILGEMSLLDSDTNVIEVAMRRLRMKIDEGQPLKLIQTVRGMGYVLDVPEEE